MNTLASALHITLDEEKLQIDPKQLLLRRLIVVGNGTVDLHALFQYELCSYPTYFLWETVYAAGRYSWSLQRLSEKCTIMHYQVTSLCRIYYWWWGITAAPAIAQGGFICQYGIGKISAVDKYQSLKKHSDEFMMAGKDRDNIEEAGKKALAVLYRVKHGAYLNFERASRFSEKVTSSACYLPPERLPPTSDAARFHKCTCKYRCGWEIIRWSLQNGVGTCIKLNVSQNGSSCCTGVIAEIYQMQLQWTVR